MNQVDELAVVQLTAAQREQMKALMTQLNTTRIVAENFIQYFAKEQGVNLQLYQFDGDALLFVPINFGTADRGLRTADSAISPDNLVETATINGEHEL